MDMWTGMLPEILEEISDRLPLRDFVAFRGVCRKWRSAPSGRSEITSFSKERPWLLFYDFDRTKSSGVAEDTCYLYNRPHPNCCAIRLPDLRDATIMHSEAGWLFVRSRDRHIFLYNPLTLTKTDLPKHNVAEEQVCTMTPRTLQRTVFIVSRITDSALEISTCRIGDTEGKKYTAEISKDQIGTMNSAYACCCTDNGHRWEACIYIYGTKRHFLYDYMNKRCLMEWTPHAIAERVGGWDEDMKFLPHQKNWLERFGEKGISISTCVFSSMSYINGIIGTFGHYIVDAGESGSTVERKSVRASWIEPRFG